MTIKRIETLEQWLILKAAFVETGYKAWHVQYDAKHPEGYQVRFSKGDKDVMVITHDQEVEADMRRSRLHTL